MRILAAEGSKIKVGYEGEVIDCVDFTSGGIFTANVGNNNQAVREAIKNQADTFISAYNHVTDIREKYEGALWEWSGYPHCALFSDGTTAVEAALRVMLENKKQYGKDRIISLNGNFHGKSLGASMKQYSKLIWPEANPYNLPYGWGYDSWWDRCAGVILEGYRGYDARFYPQEWIDVLMERKKEHDFSLCVDEIQSGFGRTGKKFAFEHYGLSPDLVVIGKAMGNGFPISGVLSKMDLSGSVLGGKDYELSSTHGGNPLACAAGLATLKELNKIHLDDTYDFRFQEKLRELDCPITGRGMVAAIELDDVDQANEIWESCLGLGLLTVNTGKKFLKLGPPLNITKEDIDKGINILKGALA